MLSRCLLSFLPPSLLPSFSQGGRAGPDESGGIHLPYGLDWRASQWDNGMDPASALLHSLEVRERALRTLNERTLLPYLYVRVRLQLIRHVKTCTTDIYLHK